MYQMKSFIDKEQSLLSMVLFFFNLVCVQSVIQLMNTPFITFGFIIKDFHFFFKSDCFLRL